MRLLNQLLDRVVPGVRILVRADLNVPLAEVSQPSSKSDESKWSVADETRIRASLPTLRALLQRGCAVVLCSHLGRPKGPDHHFSLSPVSECLSGHLQQPVQFVGGMPADNRSREMVQEVGSGEICLLENLRFDPREKQNDPEFATSLGDSIDVFVNDAFGSCHRAHASVVGLASQLPSFAGHLIEREVAVLRELRDRPRRPFWVILGGAKVSDKIGVIEQLRDRVDGFIVGGGMANTFLAAQDIPVGGSRVEEDSIELARGLLAMKSELQWVFPTDMIAGSSVDDSLGETWQVGDDPGPQRSFFDIGPQTQDRFAEVLSDAETIFWNGPLGVFENAAFSAGTRAIAQLLGDHAGTTVVGGGDTAAAARRIGIARRVTHVCTGGGAALEFLEGVQLPGLEVLEASAKVPLPEHLANRLGS